MSKEVVVGDEVGNTGPMATDEGFDAQWGSALEGKLESPAQPEAPVAQEAAVPPAPVPDQPQASEQQGAPAQAFRLPAEYEARLREVGAKDVDELFAHARNFHSLRGNLPQLEQTWRQKHLTPVEQELQALREERRQAIEDFVRVDPDTGILRTPQQQQAIRQQLAAEEAAKAQAVQKTQRDSELEQREQRVATAEENMLRWGAKNSIEQYTADLAKQHSIPVSELQTYITQTRFKERLDELPDLRMFGSMVVELGRAAEDAATRVVAQKAEAAAAKYRDVGNGAGGAGGQSSADRWDRVTDQEFDRAWEAAQQNRLT